MEEIEKFWTNIERLIQERNKTILQGIVTEINQDNRTCSVQIGGVVYEDVRLYGIVKPELKGFVMIPAVGSTVLVGRIEESNELLVLLFTEVEKLVYTVADVSITSDKEGCSIIAKDSNIRITPGGMAFVRSGSGLKRTLSDLINAITKLTVPTAVGPSGMPINAADFIKIKQDLNNYLEE